MLIGLNEAECHSSSEAGAGITLLLLGSALSIYLQVRPTGYADSMQMILAGQAVMGRALTWGIAAAFLVSGAVLWSPDIRSWMGLFFVVLGNSSYSAYLASTLVLEFTYRALIVVLPPAEKMGLESTLIYAGTLLIAVLAVGWVSYQFVEWPLVRYLQRRTGSRTGSQRPATV